MERNTFTSIAAALVILVCGAGGYWITSSPQSLPSLPSWQSAHAADAEPAQAEEGEAKEAPCCSTATAGSESAKAAPACCSAGSATASAKPCCSGDTATTAAKPCCSADTGTAAAKPCCSAGTASTAAKPCCSADAGATAAGAACCSTDAKTASSGDACCAPATKSAAAPCCEADAATAKAGAACCSSTEGISWTAEKVAEFKAKGDWCASHGVPESMCVKCNPTFVAAFQEAGDWCAGHALPSSLCTICSPKLTALGIGRDWCAAHGVPESQCVHCRPELGVKDAVEGGSFQARMADAIQEVALSALTFNLPEGNSDPIHRTGLNPNCPLHGMTVELKSIDGAEGSGLVVEPAKQDSVSQAVDCYAEVQYDESRFARVSPRASGIVRAVEIDFGQRVSQGDVLATVDSAEFGEAKAAFLRADAALAKWALMSEGYEEGAATGAVPRRDLIEAQAEQRAAEIERAIALQTLKNFGLDDPEIATVVEQMDASTLLPVRAPFDGVVVDRTAVLGDRVEAGAAVCTVADLSAMWLCLDLPVENLSKVAVGMPVEFRVDQMPDQVFSGKVTWISTEIDSKTRLGRARAVLPNLDGSLKAGLFGRGSITGQAGERLTLAPRDAVQWDGCCNLVFVQKDDQTFEPRKVQIGTEVGDQVAILAGLLPGEPIVTQGSFLLKTEILKSNIGAGCCAAHAGGEEPADEAQDAEHEHQVAAH